ncbi:tRNA dihydrouridine synthase DusB [Myxococcota bacterium]|nr:tRNA dihydrouridine synthase DusB [Myxococcota bacterium]MBU1537345.1 tRNA dihydrouridine synthase DusB [Myxococcota bacterium]
MIQTLELGSLAFSPAVFLAPMAAITTPPARIIAESYGATLTFTEMISAAALFRGVEAARELLVHSSPEKPFAVQIFGVDPHEMEYAAHASLRAGAQLLDINMGCPMKDIIRHGAGAALMKNPALAAKLVAAARRGVEERIPVTVKIRAGWDSDSLNCVPFALAMEDSGAAMVTVHGRTRSQLYRGRSNPDHITGVVQRLVVPVIANGDITSGEGALALLEQTGAAGVMIARGSFGNPWIFRDIRAAFAGGTVPPAPTPSERITVMRQHIDLVLGFDDTPLKQLTEIKKQVAWYSSSMKDSSAFRNQLFRLPDVKAVMMLIDDLEQAVVE